MVDRAPAGAIIVILSVTGLCQEPKCACATYMIEYKNRLVIFLVVSIAVKCVCCSAVVELWGNVTNSAKRAYQCC